MGIRLRLASLGPLAAVSAEVPDGAIVGVIGDDPAAISALLRLAAGVERPEAGEVGSDEPRRYLGVGDALNLAPVKTLVLDHTLARQGAVVRARARAGIERLRRSGSSILIASQEEEVLSSWCDEVWWFKGGELIARGHPPEVLEQCRRDNLQKVREWAASIAQPMEPSLRRGDGRAEIVSVETLDASGRPSMVLASGENAGVRVTVRFYQAVEDPVVGMLIRTRIGFEVFGTNTELEGVKLGPVNAGAVLQILFSFSCNLCPHDYTLTAASHDPDGIWHDWQEEAIAFTVTAPRYTAGVADLRAKVEVSRL